MTDSYRFPIDRIRPRFEREVLDRIENAFLSGPRLTAKDPVDGLAELRARSLCLTTTMAPRLHQLLNEARRKLAVDADIQLYQTAALPRQALEVGVHSLTARMHTATNPPVIEFFGDTIPSLDDATILAVIGHELGHYIAHPQGSVARRALYGTPGHLTSEVSQLLHTYRLCAEVTADRCGLLACEDIHAALRLEMISCSGLPADTVNWDTDAYLKQCTEYAEAHLKSGSRADEETHPRHLLRAYFIWLFSQSDLFTRLTGRSTGPMPIETVDGTIFRALFGDNHPLFRPRPNTGTATVSPHRPNPAPKTDSQPKRPRAHVDRSPPEAPAHGDHGAVGRALTRAANKVAPRLARIVRANRLEDVDDIPDDVDIEQFDDLQARFDALEKGLKKEKP